MIPLLAIRQSARVVLPKKKAPHILELLKIFYFLVTNYELRVFTQDSLFNAYCTVINEGPAIEVLIIFKALI